MTAAPPLSPPRAGARGGARGSAQGSGRTRARGRSSTVTRSLLLPAATATAGAVALGLLVVELVVLVAWATDSRSGSGAADAVRLGADIWLAALHTRIHVGAAVIGLPPLGLTLIATLLLARAAGTVSRTRMATGDAGGPWHELAVVTVAVAAPHAALAAALAGLAGTEALHPSPLTALVGGLAVGLLGGPLGVLRAQRRAGGSRLGALLPPAVEAVLAGAVAAVAVLGAVAALAAGALLASHAHAFGADRTALAPGAAGGAALTLLQMSAVPDAVVWAGAWLAGPGFAIGAGSSVTPWGTTLGPVPALPLLAGLPAGRSGLGAGVLVVPVLAGLVAGLVVLRRRGLAGPGAGWLGTLGLAAGTAPVAGLLGAAAAAAASGPAGPGRLATVGASPWQVGLALAAEVGVGALVAVALHQLWRHRDPIGHAASAGTHTGVSHVRVVARRSATAGAGRLGAARGALGERVAARRGGHAGPPPDADQPDAAQPDAARPEAAQPEAAQPDAAQPEAAQPEAAQPVEAGQAPEPAGPARPE